MQSYHHNSAPISTKGKEPAATKKSMPLQSDPHPPRKTKSRPHLSQSTFTRPQSKPDGQPSSSASGLGNNQEPAQFDSSTTWTSSSGDFGLLSEGDEVEAREDFVDEYNRTAKKYGIRAIVPGDFNTQERSILFNKIAQTTRRPVLPSHIKFNIHDVASTFKKLLSGLPGGILGSLSILDALVAIHSQLDCGPENSRTKETKLRARLIALAIGSVTSQYQRELICAVFGLLSLVGRTAETTPREDVVGHPLPTGDLMGYNALSIVFGPLLVGNLLDSYSMKLAVPGAGLVLFPVATQKSKKPKHLHRHEHGNKSGITGDETNAALAVDKLYIVSNITEMVITNWREIVRHMRSLDLLKTQRSTEQRRVVKEHTLRSSASDSFAANRSQSWEYHRRPLRRDDRDPSRPPGGERQSSADHSREDHSEVTSQRASPVGERNVPSRGSNRSPESVAQSTKSKRIFGLFPRKSPNESFVGTDDNKETAPDWKRRLLNKFSETRHKPAIEPQTEGDLNELPVTPVLIEVTSTAQGETGSISAPSSREISQDLEQQSTSRAGLGNIQAVVTVIDHTSQDSQSRLDADSTERSRSQVRSSGSFRSQHSKGSFRKKSPIPAASPARDEPPSAAESSKGKTQLTEPSTPKREPTSAASGSNIRSSPLRRTGKGTVTRVPQGSTPPSGASFSTTRTVTRNSSAKTLQGHEQRGHVDRPLSLGTMALQEQEPPVAQHLALVRPPSSSTAGSTSFIGQDLPPRHQDGSSPSPSPRLPARYPSTNSFLHAQVRSLRAQLEARAEEAARLQRRLETCQALDDGSGATGHICEQLRRARRDARMWRRRAEAAERRVLALERFSARFRDMKSACDEELGRFEREIAEQQQQHGARDQNSGGAREGSSGEEGGAGNGGGVGVGVGSGSGEDVNEDEDVFEDACQQIQTETSTVKRRRALYEKSADLLNATEELLDLQESVDREKQQ
ncbi:hypothetical protein SLS62_009113 [Diatrype stigma]|uniref:Rho-GAP domain-containing protein n=1 Tax=Diatrype stigma TaxID=117547 RepID=A0AAN9YK81_9PEZI